MITPHTPTLQPIYYVPAALPSPKRDERGTSPIQFSLDSSESSDKPERRSEDVEKEQDKSHN